jgi:hypothetical protein
MPRPSGLREHSMCTRGLMYKVTMQHIKNPCVAVHSAMSAPFHRDECISMITLGALQVLLSAKQNKQAEIVVHQT